MITMSETRSQAIHELLLGLNRNTTAITQTMGTISQQLETLTTTAGPALGLCGSCLSDWIDQGENPEIGIPSAQTVIVLPGVGAIPVCTWHFRELYKSQQGPQLVLAQPGMPQPPANGLIVPGR